MKKVHSLLIIGLLAVLNGCSFITDLDDHTSYVQTMNGQKLSIVFSHNINGETHPCGCRHFPLGGLPQVAGELSRLRKEGDVFYIDSGDLFFPSSTMVPSVRKSLLFTADTLLQAKIDLKMNLILPGDQDFADGLDYLKKVTAKIPFLVTNLKDETIFNHKLWAKVEKGPHQIYFLGLVEPEVMTGDNAKYFFSWDDGMEKGLKEIKSDGYNPSNPFHRLIVLSHSGMERDHEHAKKYPMIDWIIGAHDQKFTQTEETEGKTRIVQVLSRNHYLGNIKIDYSADKSKDSFEMLEMREEKAELLKPNPWVAFLDKFKSDIQKIQEEEQKALTISGTDPNKVPLNDANSCISCHKDQNEHWGRTAHASAYLTLIKNKAQHNSACIECHTLGYGKENGFTGSHQVVSFVSTVDDVDGKPKGLSEKELANIKEQYWKKVFKGIPAKSIRSLSESERKLLANKWLAIDNNFIHSNAKVDKNYANVQCLHCHVDQIGDHPFGPKMPTVAADLKKEKMINQCMNCHTPDQSPEWYKEGRPNQDLIDKHLKRIGCPKNK